MLASIVAVIEEDVAAIRAAYHESGEVSAAALDHGGRVRRYAT